MNTFQLDSLKKFAIRFGIGGAIATFIMINTVPYIMNKKIKQTEIYKEAITMVKNHSEAIKYLGEPIEDGHINVTKPNLYGSDENKSWCNVPVRGPKSAGNAYFETIYRKDEQGKTKAVELTKLELTVQSLPGYKLLIKRSE